VAGMLGLYVSNICGGAEPGSFVWRDCIQGGES
jgi:hypothetical protein